MASLNRVLLMGNLTRDPELRYIPSGQAVASFTLAMNRAFTTNGERREEASFVRVVVWARRAEVCAQYLKKGSPVFVEGRLQSRSWETQDGQKRSTLEVVANNVQFLGKGQGKVEQELNEVPSVQVEEVPLVQEEKTGHETQAHPQDEVPF
ncbi:MAG: single-stranded DNA-binding protein [Candidatus Omnitrophica bacterium]|nr:single-stranded DNA-binding protein [Candidatus Omnitrophota bacterium]